MRGALLTTGDTLADDTADTLLLRHIRFGDLAPSVDWQREV